MSLMMNSLSMLKSILQKVISKSQSQSSPGVSEQWDKLQEHLSTTKRLIDLGCGAHPHPRAVVGVDAFLEPLHRNLGYGPDLKAKDFRKQGVWFIQADLAALPFGDKEFDFAYSNHAFEHLPYPRKACSEMCRIAERGAIVTPSVFAEIAYGRSYHLWLVVARGNTLVFIKKTTHEDRPFGDHPIPKPDGGYRVTKKTNPFDILLNEGGWYHGRERMPRLSRLLRHFRYTHSPVHKVVFLWEGKFDCIVIYEDGRVEGG